MHGKLQMNIAKQHVCHLPRSWLIPTTVSLWSLYGQRNGGRASTPATPLNMLQAGQKGVLRRLPPVPQGALAAVLRPVPLSGLLLRLPRLPLHDRRMPHLQCRPASFLLTCITSSPVACGSLRSNKHAANMLL